jgi:hypothetical protein
MFLLCVVSKDKKTKCRTVKTKKEVWMKCRVQENKKKSRRWQGCLSLVSVVCLSGRGVCDGPITRAEESYRLGCVIVCGVEI